MSQEDAQLEALIAARTEAADATTVESVVALEGASRWYGEIIGVNGVTVHIPEGITGLLGPNGAGKSTFMRLAMGLMRPTTGTVRVLGENPWANHSLMKRVGFVPDTPAPWPQRSGLECVTLGARLAGVPANQAEDAARRAIEAVGLTSAMDRRVSGYSHGMQQRLKFALAIAHEPELLILDEPLTGTDPVARRHLMDLMRERAAAGTSIILSTHVLPDVEALTDRIVLLNHGRLVAHGTVDEIRNLLDQYPRTVRIVTDDPKAMGALLWQLETVNEVAAEEGAVVVRTLQPAEFHRELQRVLLQHPNVSFTAVTTLDDNVEAVFRYLVDSR
jgi:ABC-2 type transport system ATP-binding protein